MKFFRFVLYNFKLWTKLKKWTTCFVPFFFISHWSNALVSNESKKQHKQYKQANNIKNRCAQVIRAWRGAAARGKASWSVCSMHTKEVLGAHVSHKHVFNPSNYSIPTRHQDDVWHFGGGNGRLSDWCSSCFDCHDGCAAQVITCAESLPAQGPYM